MSHEATAAPRATAAHCAAALSSAAERARERAARRIALALVGAAALAWVALAVWAASPAAGYLDHGQWLRLGLYESLCLWNGDRGAVGVAAGIAAWLLMLIAMMLPTIAPLLTQLDRRAAGRPDRAAVLAAAIGGYLAVWTLFGAAAHGLDAALSAVAAASPWLTVHGWAVGAGTVALAGLYQFSALKGACRAACRAPLLAARGRDAQGLEIGLAAAAFRVGAAHGAACLGCCWALMLLMFVVGMGNLAWMLALALVMAVEKSTEFGARLGAPIGFALLGLAAALAGAHL